MIGRKLLLCPSPWLSTEEYLPGTTTIFEYGQAPARSLYSISTRRATAPALTPSCQFWTRTGKRLPHRMTTILIKTPTWNIASLSRENTS